jgi:hypothetical protein
VSVGPVKALEVNADPFWVRQLTWRYLASFFAFAVPDL